MTREERARAAAWQLGWNQPTDRVIGVLMAFADEEREGIANYIEGTGGVIPGAVVFAPLISGNNQPCMSGDPRDRLNPHVRRQFDSATSALATAIRNRKDEA